MATSPISISVKGYTVKSKSFSYTTGNVGECVGQSRAIIYACDQGNIIAAPYQNYKVQFKDLTGAAYANKSVSGIVYYLE